MDTGLTDGRYQQMNMNKLLIIFRLLTILFFITNKGFFNKNIIWLLTVKF